MADWPKSSAAVNVEWLDGVLRRSGLVEERHDGLDARVRVYSLKDGGTAELKRWLADTESLWAEQLLAFKAHVERRQE